MSEKTNKSVFQTNFSEKNLKLNGIQKYFLLGICVTLIILVLIFSYSFLSTLFIAAVIATTLYPIQKFLTQRFRIKKTISALLILVFFMGFVLVPLTFFTNALIKQASNTYNNINTYIEVVNNKNENFLDGLKKYPKVYEKISTVTEKNKFTSKEIMSTAGSAIEKVSGFLIQSFGSIVKNISLLIIHIIIFLLGIFYFLRDGKNILYFIKSLLPMHDDDRNELFTNLHHLMYSLFLGIIGAGIAQGITLTLGFAIAGINNPIFWGGVGALFSIVPYVGTALIWVPLSISLIVTGNIQMGIFLLLWSVAIVSNIDNFIKPYIIGKKTALHPFAVMIVILGGVMVFGFQGVVFGPLILMLTLSFLKIYKKEYKLILHIQEETPEVQTIFKKTKIPQTKLLGKKKLKTV